MLTDILRGRKFGDGFKHGAALRNVGHVEVYRLSGRVYLHLYRPNRSIEIHGATAALVRGILNLERV